LSKTNVKLLLSQGFFLSRKR